MTILEKIQQNEGDCLNNPSLLSEYLVILSAHIIKAEQDKTEAEINKAKKWGELRATLESDKRTDEAIKLEPEYLIYKEKEAMGKCVLETIRSIKKRLGFLAVEYHELSS